MIYKNVIRPFLFLFSAETAHHMVLGALRLTGLLPGFKSVLRRTFQVDDLTLIRDVAGMRFPNPIGLAAGLDKNALVYEELGALGFGFVEIGTVTPKPQEGNPKPRLFRLTKDHALINRMGFNNDGVDSIRKRLEKKNRKIIIGGNIGKNKNTPNDRAAEDYLKCFHELFDVVDYFVINISSPNTPGLRDLQEKEPLISLLKSVQAENHKNHNPRPVFLKIAPDLTSGQADDIIDIVLDTKLSGLIISNTTISREGLSTSQQQLDKIGSGGLSGRPLFAKSTELLKYIANRSAKKFVLIASGGIHSEEEALEKINAGADLIQLYTGFIYEGPGLIKRINKALAAKE
jgi:dihydroorotate dehydrogenase